MLCSHRARRSQFCNSASLQPIAFFQPYAIAHKVYSVSLGAFYSNAARLRKPLFYAILVAQTISRMISDSIKLLPNSIKLFVPYIHAATIL